jgi:hypothetical protein
MRLMIRFENGLSARGARNCGTHRLRLRSLVGRDTATGDKNGREYPVGDNARKGAVKKRSQLKTKLGGVSAWTKRSKTSGESWR